MVRAGFVLVIGGIIGSMIIALFTYTLYQPNALEVSHGEPVVLGPLEYAVIFEGTNNGHDKFRPDHEFFKIRINFQNIADHSATVSGGQFYIADVNGGGLQQPIFGNGTLGQDDLLRETLEPGSHITRTTQFDVSFDDEATYFIIIRPAKEHGSADHAIVCMTNC